MSAASGALQCIVISLKDQFYEMAGPHCLPEVLSTGWSPFDVSFSLSEYSNAPCACHA